MVFRTIPIGYASRVRELTPELRALHALAAAASEGPSEVDELLQRICEIIVETFGFTRASVARYLSASKTLSPVAAYGVRKDELPDNVPLESQPLFQRALESGRAVFVEDVRDEPSLSPEIAEAFGVRSALAVPLASGGRCFGFLGADRGGTVFRLDRPTLDLLTTIGAIAAVFVAHAVEESELRRLDELKTSFIALASHELRTPAAVVHGIASTLRHRGDELSAEQLRQLRRTLYEQTDRLRMLIDQLLDLSRLEAGAVDISPERFAIHRRVEELVLTHVGERSPDVRVDVPPDLEAVADPLAFDRIVSNLIANAFKYGKPPVIVSAQRSDRHLRVAVEDRGHGVTPDFVPHLFQRFTRSETSSTTEKGAGLGLSIARSYAEAHGGEILYREAEPHGARFELVLPVQREAVATP